MDTTHIQTSDPGQFIGSAVVTGACYSDRTTTLKLRTFAGELIGYTISCVPDPLGATRFSSNNPRPISVKIRDGGERCSATVLTSTGLGSSPVSLGAALALHGSGIHTVVDGGLQSGLACSTISIPALAS